MNFLRFEPRFVCISSILSYFLASKHEDNSLLRDETRVYFNTFFASSHMF